MARSSWHLFFLTPLLLDTSSSVGWRRNRPSARTALFLTHSNVCHRRNRDLGENLLDMLRDRRERRRTHCTYIIIICIHWLLLLFLLSYSILSMHTVICSVCHTVWGKDLSVTWNYRTAAAGVFLALQTDLRCCSHSHSNSNNNNF